MGVEVKGSATRLYESLKDSFFVIAGPCVIEGEGITLRIAEELKALSLELKIPFIFKASYDKANRTSLNSFRGPGLKEGLRILRKVKEEVGLPVLSDCHWPHEVEEASSVLDVIQIPAFLCRQTDLLLEAGKSMRLVNIKKGQFMAPQDMRFAVEKVRSTGNQGVILTERGSSFGYNNLVVDMRSIPILKEISRPVVFDATHSVQLPSSNLGVSGGERRYAPILAKAAVAAGADGVFFEVHPDPDRALCDGPNSIPLGWLKPLTLDLLSIHQIVKDGTDHGKGFL